MLDLLLEKLLSEPTGEYFLHVSPRDVSKMIGQKRKNINTLKEMGYICSVLPREDIRAARCGMKGRIKVVLKVDRNTGL